jgi:hypothetical protein
VFQLSNSEFAQIAKEDKELYETIVRHRYSFIRVGGVDYNSHQPKTIDPFPIDELIDGWKNYYGIMQEQMIYGESPSFDEMLKSIADFIGKLRKVAWKMGHEFLPPVNPVKR